MKAETDTQVWVPYYGVFIESGRKAPEGGHATTRACSRYRYQVSQEPRAPYPLLPELPSEGTAPP